MLGKNKTLLRSELFDGLDQELTAVLLEIAEMRAYREDEWIVSEGGEATHVFCVLNGLVRLTRREHAGREADIWVCEPGDTFGEYLVPCGAIYAQGARTATYTEVAMFDLFSLRAIAQTHPGIQANVARIMAKNLLGALDCIAGDRLQSASQRVATYFLSRCPQAASRATFQLLYQKRYLAKKLGLAPEALSRAFASLASAGVDVRGKTVCIENIDLLREEC